MASEVIFMKRKPLFAEQEVKEFNFGKHQNMNCKGFQNKTFCIRNTETNCFEIHRNYSIDFILSFFLTETSEQILSYILFFTN